LPMCSRVAEARHLGLTDILLIFLTRFENVDQS
jgi:hypothetical protein